jgi:integrase
MPAKSKRKIVDLTDGRCQSLYDFRNTEESLVAGEYYDKRVPGLFLRVGRRAVTWYFRADHRSGGKHIVTSKTLGRFPETGINSAREQAKVLLGRVANRDVIPSKRNGTKFGEAFEQYINYLTLKAEAKGKRAAWAYNVKALGDKIMLPKWSGWTLAQMSAKPDVVADWHLTVVKSNGPVSANHCARIMRAIYRRAAKRDRSLKSGDLPTSAVDMAHEKREQKGLKITAAEFRKWKAANDALAPIKRSYHLVNLLTGARPGELAKVKWSGVDLENRVLVISSSAKMDNAIEVPMSDEIIKALPKQRRAPHDLVWEGVWNNRQRDALPAKGHALRRVYKTVAADHVKVPDDISAVLLGHQPEGMSAQYLLRWARINGPAVIEAQAAISKKIVSLLG